MPRQRPIAERIEEKEKEVAYLKQRQRVEREQERLKGLLAERPRTRKRKG